MKKILYLRTDIYRTSIIAGGSITHTLGIVKGFLDLQYTVVIVSTILHQELQKLPIKKLIKLPHIPGINIVGSHIGCLISNVFFIFIILKILQQETPDYLYQRYSLLNCSGAFASKLKKIPFILEFNGSEYWVAQNWVPQKWFRKIFSALIKKIEDYNLKQATYIVVVSRQLSDELIKRHIKSTKIIICPNGVNIEDYDPIQLKEHRIAIRQQLKIENKFVFGFIGTFSQWHGINILEEIIPNIAQANNNIHFLLIGDGPLLASLKQHLKKNQIGENEVTFTGMLAPNLAKNFLAACDAFLSPNQPNPDGSAFFGSPTKIFEYLSLAKPIIASDIGQISEIIQPAMKITDHEFFCNSIGFLSDPLSAHEFEKLIFYCYNLPEEQRNLIGTNARRKAINEYQWKNQVRNIMNTVEHAL